MPRTDLDLDAFRRRLQEERSRTLADIEHAESNFADREDAATGELTTHDDHQADIATDLYEREKETLLRDNLRSVLDQIDHALDKMEDGTYGLCDACSQSIPVERLDLEPYAAYCVKDQERFEGSG